MDVIIIDSVTHEWDWKGGCLEINDQLAQTKFKGNTWSAWSVTTPRHQKFIEAITHSKCHIITTARSKTETVQNTIDWKTKVMKLGMKEIQREWFEYELTISFTIERDGHYATSSKDRTGMFIDRDPFVLTDEIGKHIAEWNESGVDPIQEEKKKMELAIQKINEAKTIADLVQAFNYAKEIKDTIWDENFKALVILKDERKEELGNPAPEKVKPEVKTEEQPIQEQPEQKQEIEIKYITAEQLEEIEALYKEYGFDEETTKKAIQWLGKAYKVNSIGWLSQDTADSIIRAMRKKIEEKHSTF